MSKQTVNATHYFEIPAHPKKLAPDDGVVNAIIETPKNSRHKYALRNDLGIIAFHEVMPDAMVWPFDYGFIPQTLADDGDPLDILVITSSGLFSGCLIEARVVGAVRETKDGIENDRLIGVPLPSPGAPQPTDHFRDVSDMPDLLRNDIVEFLRQYSRRQGHDAEIKGVVDVFKALESVKRAAKTFRKSE